MILLKNIEYDDNLSNEDAILEYYGVGDITDVN